MSSGNFVFVDMETMGEYDDSVILSIGIIYVKPEYDALNFQELTSHGLYLKLDKKEQKGRGVYKSTMDWWREQGESAREVFSNKNTIPVNTAYDTIKEYFEANNFNAKTDIIWSRGMIDQRWWLHFCKWLQRPDFLPYWRWRDTRTALDIMTGHSHGNIEDNPNMVKHNALHDACMDAVRIFSILKE